MLDGRYRDRSYAIQKCYQLALSYGFRVFAIQDGGQCFSSETAHQTYDKYGTSTECLPDGEGGPMANQVYKIKIGKGISK